MLRVTVSVPADETDFPEMSRRLAAAGMVVEETVPHHGLLIGRMPKKEIENLMRVDGVAFVEWREYKDATPRKETT